MPTKVPGDVDAPLSLAPTGVILAFIRGCWTASFCVAALMGVIVADRWPVWKPAVSHAVFLGVSLLWVLAAAWLTPGFNMPQAAIRGFGPRGKLRRTTRWLQWGWVLWAAAGLLSWRFPNLQALELARTLGLLSGLAGVVCLSIMLERLAEWARDDTAERFFNIAAWGLPASTLLMQVNVPSPFVQLFIFGLWFVAIGSFPYALVNLCRSVTLSVLHSVEHRGRQERRLERDHTYQHEVGRTVRAMDAARRRAGRV